MEKSLHAPRSGEELLGPIFSDSNLGTPKCPSTCRPRHSSVPPRLQSFVASWLGLTLRCAISCPEWEDSPGEVKGICDSALTGPDGHGGQFSRGLRSISPGRDCKLSPMLLLPPFEVRMGLVFGPPCLVSRYRSLYPLLVRRK
jgi:hypothetical protein